MAGPATLKVEFRNKIEASSPFLMQIEMKSERLHCIKAHGTWDVVDVFDGPRVRTFKLFNVPTKASLSYQIPSRHATQKLELQKTFHEHMNLTSIASTTSTSHQLTIRAWESRYRYS